MSTSRTKFKKQIAKVLSLFKPPPKLTIDEWADANRVLARGVSPEAGRFRTDRMPYQREPMAAFTDPFNGETVLMWAAQMGKTEIILNSVGFFMECAPSPILVVYPTLDSARKWSTKKLAPMIRETESLHGKVAVNTRDSANTILTKDFLGGSLIMAGSNSPASLRQISCRVVIQDEIDSYEPSAGTEGDPCLLADARASNFHDAVLIKSSTPTIKGASRIEKAFEETDQRYFSVPCFACKELTPLQWSGVRWPPKAIERAYYACPVCGAYWDDQTRIQAIMAGKWVATQPDNRRRGYHLSGLYRIMGKKRQFASFLHEFVEGFLRSKKGGRETLKVWVNTFLAETWEESGDKVESGPLLARCEDYSSEIPAEVGLLTAGVDVQQTRLEIEVVGWGLDSESWGIEKKVFLGDPTKEAIWLELDNYLERPWQHPLGAKMKVACCAIDSGDNTHTVYAFVKPRQPRRVYAVKGSSTRGAPIIAKRSYSQKGRVQLFLVGTDTAKDVIFSRLKIEEKGPRFCHFPKGRGYDEEHFFQLTAEEVRTKMRNGFSIKYYHKIRARNEALDLRVYALAAYEVLQPQMETIFANLKPEPEGKPKKVRKSKGGGFVNSWRA
jgi:phage terminase large subunit GpA-like protein